MLDAPRTLRPWVFHDGHPEQGYTLREALPDWLFQPVPDRSTYSPSLPATETKLTELYDTGQSLNRQLADFIQNHDEHRVSSKSRAQEVLRDLSIALVYTSKLTESVGARKYGFIDQIPISVSEYTSIRSLVTERIPNLVTEYENWWDQQKLLKKKRLLEGLKSSHDIKRAYQLEQARKRRRSEGEKQFGICRPSVTDRITRSRHTRGDDRKPSKAELAMLRDICDERARQASWLAHRISSLCQELVLGLSALVDWITEYRDTIRGCMRGGDCSPRNASEYEEVRISMTRVKKLLEAFESMLFAPPVWRSEREDYQGTE
ncbi:hypothetical protein F5Y15DRAFT_400056 [Xylariaceae sp. FL0016]|nr:hypothetical protein F5Y15DRAFT_400056 [Xylariaceae sp. FL0016]